MATPAPRGTGRGRNSGVFAESPDRVTEEVAGQKNWALTRAGAGPDYQTSNRSAKRPVSLA